MTSRIRFNKESVVISDPDSCKRWVIKEQKALRKSMDRMREAEFRLSGRLHKLEQAIFWLEKIGHGFGPIRRIDGTSIEYADLQ